MPFSPVAPTASRAAAAAVAAFVAALAAGCAQPRQAGGASTPEARPVPPVAHSPAPVPDVLEAARFVILRGADTVSVERSWRGRHASRAVLRVRGGATVQVDAQTGPDMLVSAASILLWPAGSPPAGPPETEISVSFLPDEVVVHRGRPGGGRTTERRAVHTGTLPWIAPSATLLEQIVRRSRAGRVAQVPLYDPVNGGAVSTAFVRRPTPDSAVVTTPAGEFRLAVDEAGRIVGGRTPPTGAILVRQALSAP